MPMLTPGPRLFAPRALPPPSTAAHGRRDEDMDEDERRQMYDPDFANGDM